MKFFPTNLRTILSNYVAADVYALFNSLSEKSKTWPCKTEGGGSRAVYTMCKKNIRFGSRWLPLLQTTGFSFSVYLELNLLDASTVEHHYSEPTLDP